ncbi:hypothetical protein H4R33_000226 [Dimargaris cristalligena]|uniref:Uncharacterized protein n=1 Tax=Dimargaris cristalligena TaxID=215637 RepID=A0A4P9ZQJ8_9FUNG|nr:hypothetical protein H4R33_000226 [Dimargaris cristalligena]RKP35575.1 hypothetical protein BJ085DRAFT_38166 [Dimargaris cristalligena]|eukprot:RKP35575.1 hypothetical protein BJ085DRAFT_38166 [Dimargaris cristalligena]
MPYPLIRLSLLRSGPLAPWRQALRHSSSTTRLSIAAPLNPRRFLSQKPVSDPPAPILVFEGPSCRAVRILKVFSVSSAGAAMASIPMVAALWGTPSMPSFGLLIFTVGFTAISSLGITVLLGFVLRPYISRIFVHFPTPEGTQASHRLPELTFMSPLVIAPEAQRTAASSPPGSSVLGSIFGKNSKMAATMSQEEMDQYHQKMERDLADFPIELRPATTLTLETLTLLGKTRQTTLRIDQLTPSLRFMKTWEVKQAALPKLQAAQPNEQPERFFWLEWKANITRFAKINEAVVWRIGRIIYQNREDDAKHSLRRTM